MRSFFSLLPVLFGLGFVVPGPLSADEVTVDAPSADASSDDASDRTGTTVERRTLIMGTLARLEVSAGSRPAALTFLADIEAVLRAAESDLSTWQADTELARFNRTPVGRPSTLSPALDNELARAMTCAELTDGAFDPAVGALTEAWDLRGTGRIPTSQALRTARSNSGYRHLERRDGAWIRHRDVIVDEGGFGKGAALDRVRRLLAGIPDDEIPEDGIPDDDLSEGSRHRALVDLGGQILLFGAGRDTPTWSVAVADPDRRTEPVLMLSLADGSVATSSNGERSVAARSTDGSTVGIGHLLDPRSGRPAPDFGSLTVWARRGLDADCLATGLFVAGPEAALRFAADRDDVEVVVVERHGDKLTARVSDGMAGRVEVISDRLSLLNETPNPLRTAPLSPENGGPNPR